MKNLVIIILILVLSVTGLRINNEILEKEAINGGSYDQMSTVPYVALMSSSYHTDVFTCTAVIISRSWLLTCAHCVQPGYSMRIGVGKSNQDLEFYVVEKAIAHHGHEAKHSYNDIALLKLVKPLTFNQFRQPIAILKQWDDRESDVDSASLLKFSGFGTEYRYTTRIDQNRVKSISQKLFSAWDCQKVYNILTYAEIDTFFCASIAKGGPCGGDSGGPVVLDNKLVGIDFYGTKNCDEPNSVQVYANVTSYYDWILKNTADDAKFIERKARAK